jgi:hypothetical protein
MRHEHCCQTTDFNQFTEAESAAQLIKEGQRLCT